MLPWEEGGAVEGGRRSYRSNADVLQLRAGDATTSSRRCYHQQWTLLLAVGRCGAIEVRAMLPPLVDGPIGGERRSALLQARGRGVLTGV